MMNFKKGSQITKEKLALENRKSKKMLATLPLNLHMNAEGAGQQSYNEEEI